MLLFLVAEEKASQRADSDVHFNFLYVLNFLSSAKKHCLITLCTSMQINSQKPKRKYLKFGKSKQRTAYYNNIIRQQI